MKEKWYIKKGHFYGSYGFHVMQGEFRDSVQDNMYEAEKRAGLLTFIDMLNKEEFGLFVELYNDRELALDILEYDDCLGEGKCPTMFWSGAMSGKIVQTKDDFVALLERLKSGDIEW